MDLRRLISELERSIKVLGAGARGGEACAMRVVEVAMAIGVHLDVSDPGWSDRNIVITEADIRRIYSTVASLTSDRALRTRWHEAFEAIARLRYPTCQFDPLPPPAGVGVRSVGPVRLRVLEGGVL